MNRQSSQAIDSTAVIARARAVPSITWTDIQGKSKSKTRPLQSSFRPVTAETSPS
jgi:hypothetical protein